MSQRLRIDVRPRGPAPAAPSGRARAARPPDAAPPRPGAPAITVAPAPSREDAADAVQGRVREALRCPYCREGVTADEPRQAPAEAPDAEATAGGREVATLCAVAAVALTAAVPLVGAGWDVLGGLSGSVGLGCFIYAVLAPLAPKLLRLVAEVRTLQGHVGEEVLACSRRGCGALYHAECWAECRVSYGACAVYACGSTEAESVTGVALTVRFVRMVVAALVFSPRLVEVLRDREDAGLAAIRASIRDQAAEAQDGLWAKGRGGAFSVLQLAVVVASFAVAIPLGGHILAGHPHASDARWAAFVLVLFGIPMLAVVGLYAASWSTALVVYFAKAVLAGELAALGRVGRASFLSRRTDKK